MNDLGTVAAETAMRSAAAYVARKGFRPNFDTLADRIRSKVKEALPVALEDAREAFEANMMEAGQKTFLASMSLAGIEAAKEEERQPEKKPGFPLQT